MTTQSTSAPKQGFRFKVGGDLDVINKLLKVLGLSSSEYIYNPIEGTITTNLRSITKEFIQQKVKELGFDFLLGNTENKNFKTETVEFKRPYINLNSVNIAIKALYNNYTQVLQLLESKIDYVDKTVIITAKVRVKDFNDLDYKVALVLTNFSYVSSKTESEDFVTFSDLYNSVDKVLNRVTSDINAEFDKSSLSPELKAFVRLFV
jgi:hypothetical protein